MSSVTKTALKDHNGKPNIDIEFIYVSFNASMRLGDQTTKQEKIIQPCLQFAAMLYNIEGTDLEAMCADIFKRKIKGKRHIAPKLSTLQAHLQALKHIAYEHIKW